MTRLLHAGTALLAILISTVAAAPVKIEQVKVVIGQLMEIPIPKNAKVIGPSDQPLPGWMRVEGDKLRMIAPPEADTQNVVVIGSLTMEILVKENNATGCVPSDEWADIPLEGGPLDNWNRAMDLAQHVDIVDIDDIRILPYEYAYSYRAVKEEEGSRTKKDCVMVVKSKCGESIMPVVEYFYEQDEYDSHLVKGSIVSRSERGEDENSVLSSLGETSTDEPFGEELDMKKEATTRSSLDTTTTRHTRSPANVVSMVSIKKIDCTQGAYCMGELDERTFYSPVGGVETFELTMESLDPTNGGFVQPWIVREGKKRMIGVIPLAAGEHTFRLNGVWTKEKGAKPQTVSTPFSIVVAAETPKNHLFKMTMFSMPKSHEFIRTAVVKLASFLRRNSDEIRVFKYDDQQLVYWNTSLPTTSCPTKEVSNWLRGLHIQKSGEMELNNDFAKAFTNKPTIHPRKLSVEWMGVCEEEGREGEMRMGGVGGVKGDKEEGPVAAESEGSLSTLITVVVLLALLLALLIVIVCCVVCKKQKGGKKKSRGADDYLSKKSPVILEGEMEDEPAHYSATTPMLVKEERPPLRVSEHSNPLYKPPPPLTLAAASPRPVPVAAGHKLPPPYVPP